MKVPLSREFFIIKNFLKKKRFLIFFAFLLYTIHSFTTISVPVYLGKLIDFFKEKDIDINSIIRNGRLFLGLFTLLIVAQIASGILIAYLNKEARIHYQNLILEKILKLPYLQQIRFRTAYLQSRWVEDSLNISSLFGEILFGMIKNLLIILFGIGIALWLSMKFSLLVLLFIILMTTGTLFISKYLIKQFKKYMEDFSTLSGKVNETISGIVELKVMGFLKIFQKTIKEEIRRISERFFSIQFKGLVFLSFMTLVIFGGFLGILMYFGFLLARADMTIGTAIGYIAIIFIIIKSLTDLISQINGLNRVFASLKRTSELIVLPEENGTYLMKRDFERIENIELRNVWFRYEMNAEYLLKGFSYKFENGKVYAITGKSGIGKSTLVKIILGIIPAEEGEILVNGEPLKKERIPSLWERIGYLSQDPFLFKGTLLENLSPLEDNLGEERIRKALQRSGVSLDDFLERMEIEEGGKNLSGGERRRLSLARAFLKEPDVLILDEPTSQIDQETEKLITKSISSFARDGKIVIIIAHRATTLEKADEVIKMV